MAKVAIVVFPGSNCDRDAFHAIESLQMSPVFHWHDEPIKSSYGAVVLPGGFSYGDYLRAGALAKISPAVQSLGDFIEKGGLVLGICNGFQILVEARYLPGAMMKNRSLRFQCEDVFVRVESTKSPFLSNTKANHVLRMPIAHSEGRFVVDEVGLQELKKNDQIAIRYCSPKGESTDEFNANGSTDFIGGITNRKGNVMGMMPHPERCSDIALGNSDGSIFFQSLKDRL